MKRPRFLFTICILAVAAGGLAVRLPRLDRRPMHCDEANQAMKTGMLFETGVYRYDPQEHHGPSLYWLTLPSLWLGSVHDVAQSSETQYRLVPVVFGVGLIVLLLLVGDGLGRVPAVLAGVFAAISPAMVFYSRYYIQETLLVFFTFAAIACGWRYVRSRHCGGRVMPWAIGAGACIGMMHATKETWILPAAAMLAALVLTAAWTRWRDGKDRSITVGHVSNVSGTLETCPTNTYVQPGAMLAGVVVACVVAVALYSSFGADWHGPIDSVVAYATYFRRGGEAGIHAHPWYYYLQLLTAYHPAKGFFFSEGLIAGLAAVGVVVALGRRIGSRDTTAEHAHASVGMAPEPSQDATAGRSDGSAADAGQVVFCRFLAFYTVVLTVLYAAIAYKTPWCLLGFLHGMTLLAGVGAWAVLRAVPLPAGRLRETSLSKVVPGIAARAILGGLLLVGAVQLGRQCYVLNYRLDADQRNPYVYAHTSRDVLNLAAQMQRLAEVSPQGNDMVIHVVTPQNYWPLPWYLRKFNGNYIGYWQDAAAWHSATKALPAPSVIILTDDVQQAVDAQLPGAYNRQMIFGLRPGVLLNVYVREDLWAAFLSANSSRS